jgi:hypothetical protein
MFCSFTAINLRESLVYPDHPEMERDHKNVWPKTSKSLLNFKENFLFLGKLINKYKCQSNVIRHISNYVTKIDPTFNNRLNRYFKDINNHESYGRLITYFPPDIYIHEREGDK